MTETSTNTAIDYENDPKGSVDYTGRYFGWDANLGSSSDLDYTFDFMMVKIPFQKFSETTPSISYSATTLNEVVGNDGTITETLTLTLSDDTFVVSGSAMTVSTHYTVANVPAGLTAVVTGTSTTTATLGLTGTASAHENANDVSNLTLTFLDAAFTTSDAADVTNYTRSDLAIDFDDAAGGGLGDVDWGNLDTGISITLNTYPTLDVLTCDTNCFAGNGAYSDTSYATTGDWYARFTIDSVAASNDRWMGLTDDSGATTYLAFAIGGTGGDVRNNANVYQGGDISGLSVNDHLVIAIDNGEVKFYHEEAGTQLVLTVSSGVPANMRIYGQFYSTTGNITAEMATGTYTPP